MKLINTDELAKLIIEFKNGEESKFEEIYELTWRHAYYAISRKFTDADEISDFLQEVYLQVFKSIDKLEDEKSFLAWIDSIINNRYIDYIRKCQRRKMVNVGEEKLDEIIEENKDYIPEEKVLLREEISELKQLIAGLPKAQRQSIEMYYFADMTIPEIAKKTGVSENVVRKRLFDARKTIKKRSDELSEKYKKRYNINSLGGAPILLAILVDEALQASIFADAIAGETLKNGIIELAKKPIQEAAKKTLIQTIKIQATNFATPIADVVVKGVLTNSIAVGIVTATISFSAVSFMAYQNQKQKNSTPNNTQTISQKNIIEQPALPFTQINSETNSELPINSKVPIQSETIVLTPAKTQIVEKVLEVAVAPTKTETTALNSEQTTVSQTPTIQNQEMQNSPIAKNSEKVIPSEIPLESEEPEKLPPIYREVTLNYGGAVTESTVIKDTYFTLGNFFDLQSANAPNFNKTVDNSKAGNYITTIFAKTEEKNQEKNQDRARDVIINVKITIGDSTPPTISSQSITVNFKIGETITEPEIINKAQIKINDDSGENLNPIFIGLENIDNQKQGEYPIFVSTKDLSQNHSETLALIIIVE